MPSRAGFILAGGASRRMGRDKALLPYRGGALVEHIAAEVFRAAGSVTLVGTPERYRHLPWPAISDLRPGDGPLAGIEAALAFTTAEWNLVVACDMPAVEAGFLENLLAEAEAGDADCLIPVTADGCEHPVCAVYHRRCLNAFRAALDCGIRQMSLALARVRAIRRRFEDHTPFANINRAEDLLPKMTESFPHYVEFRHVYKTFDAPVLVDISFHVNAGETVAIIGRSGVGKSVTLSLIMGFNKPDQGRVIVAHEDITEYSEAELRRIRRKVTMVFQSGALFDSLTIAENILFSLELREDYNRENKEEVVHGLLKMVDLEEYADAYPSDISTGYKRAVAIARALAAQPECVLYDEPTTMVDPIMSDHVANLMLRLKHQLRLTSVVVTHDLDLMRKVADRVVVLHEGRVIYDGTVPGLEESDHPHIREFLELDRV